MTFSSRRSSLALAPDSPSPEVEPAPSIADLPVYADRVSKWYGPVIGLNEVSIKVNGGIVALLGPNGAGKSTLIKLLTGQLRPSIGKIRIFGRSVRSPVARRMIGYCPDVDAFYEEMSGREFVEAMVRLCGFPSREARERTERALETVGMSDEQNLRRADKKLRGCSKGMRQRIKLAQAIAHDPRLLILDEPMSGLDPVGRRDFNRLFRQFADQGKTLLISSHILTEMEDLADSVILVAHGRVLTQGSWEDVGRFLEHLPQPVSLVCDRARELASELVRWPGVIDIHMKTDREVVVTTRDPEGLCRELARLVCARDYRVERLQANEQWAGTLFSLAGG